jgi:hypothetical protein
MDKNKQKGYNVGWLFDVGCSMVDGSSKNRGTSIQVEMPGLGSGIST